MRSFSSRFATLPNVLVSSLTCITGLLQHWTESLVVRGSQQLNASQTIRYPFVNSQVVNLKRFVAVVSETGPIYLAKICDPVVIPVVLDLHSFCAFPLLEGPSVKVGDSLLQKSAVRGRCQPAVAAVKLMYGDTDCRYMVKVIPYVLAITRLCESQCDAARTNMSLVIPVDLDLQAIIRHTGGTLESGHYTTDVRLPTTSLMSPHSGRSWIRYDDAVVTSITEEVALCEAATLAYVLFYERLSGPPEPSLVPTPVS